MFGLSMAFSECIWSVEVLRPLSISSPWVEPAEKNPRMSGLPTLPAALRAGVLEKNCRGVHYKTPTHFEKRDES